VRFRHHDLGVEPAHAPTRSLTCPRRSAALSAHRHEPRNRHPAGPCRTAHPWSPTYRRSVAARAAASRRSAPCPVPAGLL